MERWIEFPGLGLRFENMKNFIEVGDFKIYWYGIIISLAFLVGIILIMGACRKYGFSQDDIITYILFAIPAAIIGARLYFVVFSWDHYKDNLSEIFNLRNGGLAIYGGIIAAAITVAIVSKVKKQSFLRVLDLAIPYIVLGQAIGRWGNFINQEAYGKATDLPWRMTGSHIPGAVHPNFLYESIGCLLIFIFLIAYRRKFQKYSGEVLFLYMITYGLGRAFMEYIRGDDALLISDTDIRVSFVLSLVLVAAGIIGMIVIRRLPKYKVDKELLAVEARHAYIKDTGKDPDTKLPVDFEAIDEESNADEIESSDDENSEDSDDSDDSAEDDSDDSAEDELDDGSDETPADSADEDSESKSDDNE